MTLTVPQFDRFDFVLDRLGVWATRGGMEKAEHDTTGHSVLHDAHDLRRQRSIQSP